MKFLILSPNIPVATLMRSKSSYSNTSPFAITGIETAATTSAISFHLAGSLGLSETFLPVCLINSRQISIFMVSIEWKNKQGMQKCRKF